MNFIVKFLFVVLVIGCLDQLFGYVPSQVQAFKKAIQNSTKVTNCANCDFRGVQGLAGVDAHGAHMPGATFQPCLISSANKGSAMICIQNQVADLTGINLANVNLFSACLDWAILENADLSGADLSNTSVQDANLKGATVKGMITANSTFCNSVMPDGKICTESWTGQGITIACNCAEQDKSQVPLATPPAE